MAFEKVSSSNRPALRKVASVLRRKDGILYIKVDDFKKGLVLKDDSTSQTRWFQLKSMAVLSPNKNAPDFVVEELYVDINNPDHVEELVEEE